MMKRLFDILNERMQRHFKFPDRLKSVQIFFVISLITLAQFLLILLYPYSKSLCPSALLQNESSFIELHAYIAMYACRMGYLILFISSSIYGDEKRL